MTLDHFSKGAWTAKCLQMMILRSRLHDIGCQRDRRPGVVFRLNCDNARPKGLGGFAAVEWRQLGLRGVFGSYGGQGARP